ncbi:maleylacetoacetate isomerase [Roseospira navarrensis]|uniref:Maleylacetoacetate isomerase n=1 Tax=Roseospira navarrensis TaxID=140058 RepID=A0A7X1ZDK7_9PROT|nr:maleylacetoacetate isomerase [Roseospira navarrensis]MQX35581.1 maleylacetoacetate isomerase [Roseospira navarrensis]
MKLYTYWRSSAAYRVRIALDLKGLPREDAPVHLVRDGGEHRRPDYAALNPQRLVPTLVLDDGTVLTQSLAILEYLDETHPTPPLLPADPVARAQARALAQAIAMDIHPVNNLRVLNRLADQFGADAAAKAAWYRHWIAEGLAGVEALLTRTPATGAFCHGESPGLADVCLVPQVYNARRFEVDLSPFPTVARIDAACRALPAFQSAAPEAQPDAG